MNKKFSTLVAVLLAAGTWTTLDARVIEITKPEIGGSYLIGSKVTQGDGADGKMTDLLQTADIKSAAAEGAVQAYGNNWTLEAVIDDETGDPIDGQFYLVVEDQYLSAKSSLTAGDLELAEFDEDATVKFVITESGCFAVADQVTNGSNTIAQGKELVLAANTEVKATGAASAGTVIKFATYQADEKVTVKVGAARPSQITMEQSLVSSFDKDTYYFIAAEEGKLLSFASKTATEVTKGKAELTKYDDATKYLWKVVETTAGGIQYRFENKAYPGKYANIGSTSTFATTAKYDKGVALAVGENAVDADFTAPAAATTTSGVAFGFYEAILAPYTAGELNKDLEDGFNLSINVKKDDKGAIQGAEVFEGKLEALPVPGVTDLIYLTSGDKYVVLNTKNIWAGNVGNASLQRGAKFELVDEAALEDESYLFLFSISHSLGTDVAENLVIKAVKANHTEYGQLFVISTGDTNYLTTSLSKSDNETWPYVKRGASNIVDVRPLLGKFWNISYAESKEAAKEQDEEYKLNGVLSTVYDGGNQVDYVDAGSVLLTSPEAQWAVTSVDAIANTFIISNRESSLNASGLQLRTTDTPNVYLVSSSKKNAANIDKDLIKLTEVKNHGKYDGFMKTDANTLRNQVFHIGQYHNETGNAVAYWTENHDSSHKLGVSTENATDWKLSLGMKTAEDKKNQVDTTLLVTDMVIWKDNQFVTGEKLDTLAVLPYKFQNNGNLEYVLYKGNKLNYYACDEVADVKENAQTFGLKIKPNGTYNIVTLFGNGLDYLGGNKVYVANSDQKGSLDNMLTYEKDNNSLMVIEEISKPEYRKVKAAWGDTVKIYREEYPTEVLFEKRDTKSVVDGETLSFLNVNNSVTGANPALFVDTAYVNRVDTNGVLNTRYQYLLAVEPRFGYHNSSCGVPGHPTEVGAIDTVYGRFLVNLIDTAFAYKQEHLHNNPYINMVEADENLAKLSFVNGYHTNDALYITRKGGEIVKLDMDSAAFNVAKFAFRYVDNNAGSFKIQTQYKDYSAKTQKDFEKSADDNGYLRWVNGTVVVTNKFTNGEVFNMEENYNGNPVANEDITASSISVVATNGAVIIKGAAGKKVAISNVLGQTVANTVLSSDEATIAAPAGVVVVAVEGEAAVKAIVK